MGRILVDCVAERPVRHHGVVDGDALLAGAEFHGIEGWVHRAAENQPDATWLDGPTRARLGDGARRAVARHLLVLADLSWLHDVLEDAEVDVVVVKGPALVETVYGHPSLRTYSDLDVVVPAARLRHAVEALEAAGATLLDRDWSLLRRDLRGEVHVALPLGTLADLHWHLIPDRRVRDGFRVRMTELFEHARAVGVEGRTIRTPDAEHTLVHLGLHTALSGAHRLLWFKDFDQVARVLHPDWDEVVAIARRWGAGVALGTALQLARTTIGAPVPRDVVHALVPARTWRTAVAVARRLSPPERADGFGSLTRVVCRSVRADPRATGRELARRGAHTIRNLPGGQWRRPVRGRGRSASRPRGDPGARDRYLDAVAHAGG